MWFAQTPTPLATPLPAIPVQSESIALAFTPLQMMILGVYFLVCLSLIVCVTLSTSKSEGLMQQSMSAPSQPTAKGKMTTDERLAGLTTNLAYTFLGMSIVVAYMIHI